MLTSPGDGVIVNPPVYPPFFADIAHTGRTVVEVPLLRDGASGRRRDRGRVRRGRAGLRALQPAQPDRARRGRGTSWRRVRGRRGGARRVGALRRDPRAAGLRRDRVHAVPVGVARAGAALTSASKAFNLAGLKLGIIVSEHVERLPPGMNWRAGYLGAVAAEAAFTRRRRVARRDARDDRAPTTRYLAAELPAGIAYAVPQASYLAWLDCRAAGLGDDPARGVPRARAGRAVARAGLRRAGRRLRAAERRDDARARGGGRQAPGGGADALSVGTGSSTVPSEPSSTTRITWRVASARYSCCSGAREPSR